MRRHRRLEVRLVSVHITMPEHASSCRLHGPEPAVLASRVMAKTIDELDAVLTSAFPAVSIDRATIDEPSALWHVYDDSADLTSFDGRTWTELSSELVFRHSTLPIYAGDSLFHSTVPAYLRYLMHERTRFNDLPLQLGAQLTRRDDPETHPKFDRRVALFNPAQRIAVRDVLAHLATVRPMEDTMACALATWNNLEGVA